MRVTVKTPVLEREIAPHKRRRGGRVKPFAIEGRYIGEQDGSYIAKMLGTGWRLIASYETERDRQNAFRTLTSKGTFWNRMHEYRLKEEPNGH